jgi:hypothetical protein
MLDKIRASWSVLMSQTLPNYILGFPNADQCDDQGRYISGEAYLVSGSDERSINDIQVVVRVTLMCYENGTFELRFPKYNQWRTQGRKRRSEISDGSFCEGAYVEGDCDASKLQTFLSNAAKHCLPPTSDERLNNQQNADKWVAFFREPELWGSRGKN